MKVVKKLNIIFIIWLLAKVLFDSILKTYYLRVFQSNYILGVLKYLNISSFVLIILTLFWSRYLLNVVKKSEYFKPIHNLRIIDVIIEYTKDPKTINFNLLTFYIILLFIGTSHNFYSIFQLTYNLKFLLQIRVSIIILVIIISYFSKKDLFYILNAVFVGLFMIHYVILFILDEWYLVKDVLYPLMLMPIEFEFIKNLSKKYGKEIIRKIIFSLSLLAIGVLTLYFTGYIS